MHTSPARKTGKEIPTSAPGITKRSAKVPWRIAEMTTVWSSGASTDFNPASWPLGGCWYRDREAQVSSHTRSVSGSPLMSSGVSGASGTTPACSSREASWRTCWVVCQTVRSSISCRLVVPK